MGDGFVHYNPNVDEKTRQKLIDLNELFYQTFGGAFGQTRQHVQPGVRKILKMIPKMGNWLDWGVGMATWRWNGCRRAEKGCTAEWILAAYCWQKPDGN